LGEGADATLYSYVWNSPTNLIDPLGLWGGGSYASASASGGVVTGMGATGAVGAGVFYNPQTGQTSSGAFASGGAFVGNPLVSASSSNSASNPKGPPCQSAQSPWALGAYAGAGRGAFCTNANNISDLSGPFNQYNFDAGPISLSFQYGYNSNGDFIGVFSFGAGPGAGISASAYSTTTATTAPGPYNH
jgi:hypothetical protein